MKYEYVKLFLNFLSSIAWPALIMLIIIFFEKQIRKLIKNIKKVEAIGSSIEINNQQKNSKNISTLEADNLGIQERTILTEYLEMYNETTRQIVLSSIEKEASVKKDEPTLENFNTLLNYSTILFIEKHFQNLYNIIYGSQIELLNKLDSNDNETKNSLKYIYDNAVSQRPEFYKDYSYGQYLQFLENYALIHIAENNNVTILDQGEDFLTFIERTGFSKSRPIY